MAEQDKKSLDVESLEVTELEDADLEDVAGGATNPNTACNESCPQTVNTSCPVQPATGFTAD
jgi:hypothetical protein